MKYDLGLVVLSGPLKTTRHRSEGNIEAQEMPQTKSSHETGVVNKLGGNSYFYDDLSEPDMFVSHTNI
jgi:hypothetical protein